MKKLLLALTVLSTLSLTAQKQVERDLKDIETEEQAVAYVKGKERKTHKVFVFNEEIHKSKLAKELLESGVGGRAKEESQFEIANYKVVSKSNEPHYRLRYIYLDGNKLSGSQIEKIRKEVSSALDKKLYSFADLAKKYSMARNAFKGGDTSWVKLNELPEPLMDEKEYLKHAIDDVYYVKDLDKNEFYIVQKTHSAKRIKEVTVLKVISVR